MPEKEAGQPGFEGNFTIFFRQGNRREIARFLGENVNFENRGRGPAWGGYGPVSYQGVTKNVVSPWVLGGDT
jgi:hypothetical protein